MHILKEFFRHYKIVLIPSHFDKVWQKKPLSKVLFTQFHTCFALICFRNIWTKISLLWAEPLSCFIAEAPSSKLTCVTNWKCLHIALFSTHQNPLFSIKFRCQMSKAYMSLHQWMANWSAYVLYSSIESNLTQRKWHCFCYIINLNFVHVFSPLKLNPQARLLLKSILLDTSIHDFKSNSIWISWYFLAR